MKVSVPFWRTRETWVALLLTSGCFGGVALLAQRTWPPVLLARSAPFVPHLVALTEEQPGAGLAIWDRDPRALGSPVLFALPTAAGFSPSRDARSFPAAPALQGRPSASLWLDRMPVAAPMPGPLRDRTTPELGATLAARWERLPPIADPFESSPLTQAVIQVEWPDGQPQIVSGLPISLLPAPTADEKPWEVSARIFFSNQGEARSVFLEQSTAPRERADSLTRALRRLRVDSGAELSARVNLYFQRPAQEAARVAEEAQ
ncbi:MAG: hypothetical protein M9935_09690 [Kiritimatiellae bacterium]|nr:hypothetical protein [Kiritimatiellia bacterium]